MEQILVSTHMAVWWHGSCKHSFMSSHLPATKVYPVKQVQTGSWSITWHVPLPHEIESQGSKNGIYILKINEMNEK